MDRKRKHTTSSGSPDFDDDSADSDPAYMHGKHGLSLFFVIFLLLYMLAQNVVFRQTMADDPKTFNIFSRATTFVTFYPAVVNAAHACLL